MTDTFEVELEHLDGYRARADFGPSMPPLVLDEPPPLGGGQGPNPARLLGAAVGSCLQASLLFALHKARVPVAGLGARVVGSYRRNERKRLRIGGLAVTLRLDAPGAAAGALRAPLEAFEDFCVVTASVRQGLAVTVRVEDARGATLFESPAG